MRIALWGVAYPMLLLLAALTAVALPVLRPFALVCLVLLLLVFPVMVLRIAANRHRNYGDTWKHSLFYGAFVLMGKLPEAVGGWRYLRTGRGKQAQIIEYK